VNPVLVMMSRITAPSMLGLQVVNATSQAGGIDVRSAFEGVTRSIVRDVPPGAILPRPPKLDLPARSYGVGTPDASIEVLAYRASNPGGTESWTAALDAGGVSAAVDGRSYALAVLGPSVGAAEGEWYERLAVTVLDADPFTADD
jgi:hypothetical protein